MDARFVALAFAALAGSVSTAGAREIGFPREAEPVAAGISDPLQVAQVRDVQVFYDEYGREVLLDAYTGEVISIREPHERSYDPVEPSLREPPSWMREPQYPDEAEIGRRMRHERRLEQLQRTERLPEYRDYRVLPEPIYPEEDPYYRESEPQGSEPLLAAPAPVERQPLTEAARDAPLEDQIEEILRENRQTGSLPQVDPSPRIGMNGATEEVARYQVLLDRVGASPGVIDGRMGDNVNKAIDAYRAITGEILRTYDKDFVAAQLEATGGDAFTTYEITPTDVAGPYVASIPDDYGEKAKLERMGYVSVIEMLAERFHMDPRFLQALNPEVNFDRPGSIITVANLAKPLNGEVARIIADKGAKQVRAYGREGELIAVYPATIGSQETPSPTGTHTVERIAFDPEYTYNPKINFRQGNNDKVLTIPPGPNGPVGTVWIALSKPTYGIHGTPEPSKIGKTNSNGCIRLTNWDAQELAKMVKKGVTVEFVE